MVIPQIDPKLVDIITGFILDQGYSMKTEQDLIELKYAIDHIDELKIAIRGHLLCGTCYILEEKGEIIAFLRWNWITRNLVYVADCVIREDKRSIKLLKLLIKKNIERFPNITDIVYQRGRKNRKEYRIYKIQDLL